MSSSVNEFLLSKAQELKELHDGWLSETAEPTIWLQTVAGDIIKVEHELRSHSPLLSNALDAGVGFTRSNPIYLAPDIKKDAVEMILDYFRFHHESGRSRKDCELFDNEFLKKDESTLCKLARAAKCLNHEGLIKMICRAIARHVQNSSPEVKQDFIKSFEKRVKGEELEPQNFLNGDLRTRLSNKLLEKQKKELQDVENVKKAEVQKQEDRSIDDLMSFINGGGGDTKGVQTSKKKKKNCNKGKEKKKTSSCNTISSTEASLPKKVCEDTDCEDINAYDSAKPSGPGSDAVKLLGIGDESFGVNEEPFYVYSDPALEEKDNSVGFIAESGVRLCPMSSIKQDEGIREICSVSKFNPGSNSLSR